MENLGFVLVALAVLIFGVVSRKAQRGILTPPMVFTGFGLLIGAHGLHLVDLHVDHELIHLLAEITLVLVLFTDASRIDLKLLRRDHDLPVRLLTIGLPLIAIAGTVTGMLVLGLTVWNAALLAALLTPTDAALGQAVVSDRRVPVRIRQTLNVESGLNDGLALPLVLILLTVACAVESVDDLGVAYWLGYIGKQLVFGPLVGIAVGWLGAKAVDKAIESEWMEQSFAEIAAVALALLAFAGAELVGGNGFIAAFVGGLVLGNTSRNAHELESFAEAEGQLLTLLVFLVFGGAILPETFHIFSWQTALYAVLSLTVVRMVPVAISLLGKTLRWESVAFLGWFGPRGIATVLFSLLVIEGAPLAGHEEIVYVAMLTVAFSIVLHGISAAPLAGWYAKRLACEEDEKGPEHAMVSEMMLPLEPTE
ncbi:MAG: cation:proton antiporter [Acidobacteriota bacterium]